MSHTFDDSHCEVCGQAPCAHVDSFAPKKRGRPRLPHANRVKMTIYISKSLKHAIISSIPETKDVSVWIREHLESLFPDHREVAEQMINHEEKENE